MTFCWVMNMNSMKEIAKELGVKLLDRIIDYTTHAPS